MKKRIIMLPIEPLDMRYSSQWYQWFMKAILVDKRFDLKIVYPGTITSHIRDGAFLDVCGTNYAKASQLMKCSQLLHEGGVKDGDIFFLHDAWFPGVEMLAYMRDGLGIDFKITGCFHAGTYDPTDFISKKGMGNWGIDLENAWSYIYDKVFVATEFHKSLILNSRTFLADQIEVSGFPIFPQKGFLSSECNKQVVFPHRLTEDKQPELFDQMKDILGKEFPDWSFVKTQEIPRTKEEYYQVLANSSIAVSFAKHENFGIGMIESVFSKCLPVVPDKLSYKELYSDEYKYQNFDGAVNLVREMMKAIDGEDSSKWRESFHKMSDSFTQHGKNAIPNILNTLASL